MTNPTAVNIQQTNNQNKLHLCEFGVSSCLEKYSYQTVLVQGTNSAFVKISH